jgi:hypothetical protein
LSHNADDFSAFASFINLMDLSRPAVIGITTPDSTMFRNGKIGADQAALHCHFLPHLLGQPQAALLKH